MNILTYDFILFAIVCNVSHFCYVGFSKRNSIYDAIRFKKSLETDFKTKTISLNNNYKVLFIKHYMNLTKDEIRYKRELLLIKLVDLYPEYNIIDKDSNNKILYINIDNDEPK